MESIAVATLITAIIWMYLCEIPSKELRFSIKENFAIGIIIISFLFCGYEMEAIIGCIVYCIVLFLVCLIAFNDEAVSYTHLLMDEYLYSDSRVKQNINKVKLVSYLFNKKKKYCFALYKIFSKIEFSSLKKKLKMLLYLSLIHI